MQEISLMILGTTSVNMIQFHVRTNLRTKKQKQKPSYWKIVNLGKFSKYLSSNSALLRATKHVKLREKGFGRYWFAIVLCCTKLYYSTLRTVESTLVYILTASRLFHFLITYIWYFIKVEWTYLSKCIFENAIKLLCPPPSSQKTKIPEPKKVKKKN
mgnify:CR=1 FL=1